MSKRFKFLLILSAAIIAFTAFAWQADLVQAASVTTPEGIVFDTATGTITDYTGAGGDLVIPDTIEGVNVTTIDSRAFEGAGITNVTLPSALKTIKSEAFRNNLLTQITLPDSVRHVAYEAFIGNSITSFTLPTINDAGFYGWYTNYGSSVTNGGTVSDMIAGYIAVYEYTLTDDDVVVTDGVIESCTVYATEYIGGHHPMHITIPSTLDSQTVTGISDNAFWGLQLVYADLPDTVEYIGENAFSINYLREINLPSSLSEIDDYAFTRNGISTLNIPGNVETIGREAFKENALTQVTIQDGVETIQSAAFYDNNLNSITFPNSIIYIGHGVVSQNNITSFIVPTSDDPEHLYWASSTGDMYTSGQQYSYLSNDLSSVKEYVLTDENSTVVDGVLQEWSYLDYYTGGGKPRHIVIPEILDGQTVTEIRYNLFDNAGLFYVDLPDTITHINEGAFKWCRLRQIDLPASIEYIGNSAFLYNLLETVVIPEGISEISDYCFRGNKLTSIILPQSITKIGNVAFGSNMLSEVSFSENVQYIGERAFAENPLTSFNLPVSSNPQLVCWTDSRGSILANGESLSFMDSYYTAVFSYTLTDDDVVVTDGVVTSWTYDEQVYQGSGAPVYIIMPSVLDGQTVVELGEDLFDNDDLIYIDLPDTIHTIGDYAFSSCNLSDIDFPASLEVIGRNAFYGNDFETLIIPDGVTTLGSGCFSMNKLQSVSLPGSVIEIGADAFYHFPGYITSFQLPNSQDSRFTHWMDSNYNTYAGGTVVSDLTCDYYVVIEYTLTDDDVVVTDGVIQSYNYNGTGFVQNANPSFIYIPDTLDGQTVTGIGQEAFKGKLLRGVSMADSIVYIDKSAFYFNNIMYVNLPNNLEKIDSSAFYYNKLRDISFPNTLKHIGNEAFRKNNLNETSPIIFPDSIRYLGSSIFLNNDGTFAPITFPEITEPGFLYWLDLEHYTSSEIKHAGDTVIGPAFAVYNYTVTDDDVVVVDGIITQYSYNGTSYLGGGNPRHITIPSILDGQTIIGIAPRAFKYKGLVNIILPDTLRTIGTDAFSVNYIDQITLPNSVVEIDRLVFRDTELETFVLPQPSDERFSHWVNSELETFNAGDTINVSEQGNYKFEAVIYYTLTDDDVVVNNGVLESYTYSGTGYIDNLVPTRIIIPDFLDGQTVTEIGDEAFKDIPLKYVSIADTVTKICDKAFYNCNLDGVDLSDNLIEIGVSAFSDNSISGLVLPSTIKFIERYAFNAGLREGIVTIPDSIRFLGDDAFLRPGVGENFVIPTVTDSNFMYWYSDAGVKYYGGETIDLFSSMDPPDARMLIAVYNYTITDDDVYVVDGEIQGYFYEGIGNEGYGEPRYITIPNYLDGQTVKEIGSTAFSKNNITDAILPDTLENIGSGAFKENLIREITIPNSVRYIGGGAFGSLIESFVLPTPDDPYFIQWVDMSNNATYPGGATVTDTDHSFKADCGIAVTGVILNKESTSIQINNTEKLEATVTPLGATNKNVVWSSSNETIATVDTDGTVTGIGIGECVITVTTEYGSFTDTCTVTIAEEHETKKVAILFGMADYVGTENDLNGPVNDIIALGDTLTHAGYTVYTYMNYSAADLLATVESTVSSLWFDDTLLFGYSGHGGDGGYLFGADNGAISISALESKLSLHTGVKEVLLDACFSGDFIGKNMQTDGFVTLNTQEDFNDYVISVFSESDSQMTAKNLAESGYYVITASSGSQLSYEYAFDMSFSPYAVNNLVSFQHEGNDYYWMGFFSTAFEDGFGLFNSTPFSTIWADSNADSVLTWNEIYQYAALVTNEQQQAQVYPVNSDHVLFTSSNVRVTGVTLDDGQVDVGGTLQLNPVISPSDATNQIVYYASSDETVVTVDDNGLVTGVSLGSAIITVVTDDGAFADTCIVTSGTHVESVTLTPETLELAVDDTYLLTTTVSPANATNQNVTYTSSNEDVATVDAVGMVWAHAGGTATITVITEDGEYTDTCVVTVVRPVTGVSLSHSKTSILTGSTLQLTATIAPSDATNTIVVYASDNEAVATVDATGLVTSHTTGSAVITVTTQDGSFTDTCTVMVADELIISDTFTVNRLNAYLEGIPIGATVQQILDTITTASGDIRILDADGQPITGDVLVSTSYYVQLVVDDVVVDELCITIEGDVNPDTMLNIIDYTLIRLHILDLEELTGVALDVADVNNDGVIDIIDYTLVRLHILELESLYE